MELSEADKISIVARTKTVMIAQLQAQKTQIAADLVQYTATAQAKAAMLDAQIALANGLLVTDVFPPEPAPGA